MTDSVAITAASMLNSMTRLDVISHNLANANTTGYKRDLALTAPFDLQLSASIAALVPGSGEVDTTSVPPGVDRVSDMRSGVLRYTGNDLDVAIEGDGFFQVIDGNKSLYTRNGNFQRDAADRLVNSAGFAVAGQSGDIRLGDGAVFIDAQGQVWEDERIIDRLRVVEFADAERLQKRGGGLYAADGLQSMLVNEDSVRIRQGYLEASNVAAMQEMVDLMSTLRHFEMSQHVVKGYDEMIGQAIEVLGQF